MKDDFLWTTWQEDRTEIRLIRDRIYTTCTFVTVASFAVSAFLLGKDQAHPEIWKSFFLVIDLSFVGLLWIIFGCLKRDLTGTRKCLDVRESLIREKLATGTTCKDPFSPTDPEKPPSMNEHELYLVPILATVAITVKGFIIWLVYSGCARMH